MLSFLRGSFWMMAGCSWSLLAAELPDSTPAVQQTAKAMRTPMNDLPRIRVGQTDGDIMGRDNRALQAAVDYVAALGGGEVLIGPGEYLMRDSLHVRSFVRVVGTPGKTVLRKADGISTPLSIDGDYGEEQITVTKTNGIEVGCGITIWDNNAGGFHTTVARVIGQRGDTFALSRPLNADCMVSRKAMAATVFPVVSVCDTEGARIEHLIIHGNREHNVHLNGCRGGGIFLYRGFGTIIKSCEVREFNGDGISFQQSNDVVVEDCRSEGNASLGLHPGSGSQRPIVRNCVARNNGEDGLFLCWRVRFGIFEGNLLEGNGGYGISIGHKDTDNLLRLNKVRENHGEGIYFRDETYGMAGHRNRLEENLIENNGVKKEVAGIRVRGQTHDVILKDNIIRDTRGPEERRQITGIRLDEKAGPVTLQSNRIDASTQIQDQRRAAP